MTQTAARFYEGFKSTIKRASDIPDLFVYHLTIDLGHTSAKVKAVKECYDACDLSTPNWLASHFSNGLKSKPKKFVKKDGGYRLENSHRERIAAAIGANQGAVQTSTSLNKLEALVPDGAKREFLHETINCFTAGANRAAVVMCWNLTLHHIQDYILAHHLAAFNASLGNNKDSRVKIKNVTKQDDFTEMPESKFLLFCREAKIVTASMFKKLEGRLDERNSAAHPSGVKITPKFAEAYIEDIVENVIRKFVV